MSFQVVNEDHPTTAHGPAGVLTLLPMPGITPRATQTTPTHHDAARVIVPLNSSAVACPGWLIPSRLRVFHTVMTMILRSNRNDCLSTYHTSSANFCSQVRALRPFT